MTTNFSSTPSPGYSNEYSGEKLVVFTAIFVPVQIFCVASRYLARYLISGPWGLDDVVVMTSLILQLSMAGIAIGSVEHAGVGYHIPYLLQKAPDKVVLWAKYLVAIEFIYFGGVNIPKLAILALYYRLFPKKGIRIVILILSGILLSLTVSTVVTASVACRPFSANWEPTMRGTVCIDKEAFFIWGSIPNIITDIVMLVLPMRVVWKLHTSTRLKVGLTITFAVGSFGLITSVVRFATFFQKNSFIDGTWAAVDLIIWTQVEAGVYLICACLPTYRPLLERIGPGRLYGRFAAVKRTNTYNMITTKEKVPGVHDDFSQSLTFDHQARESRIGPQILVTTNIQVDEDIARSV